jgi:hypothetical protein
MGFKDVMDRIRERNSERKSLMQRAEMQDRIETLVEEKKKSANQRELERLMNEEREKSIKEQLDIMRKSRERDISFGHNPLDVKNITSHTEWNVLREKNQFASKSNMFQDGKCILKNNPNLLKNEKWLMKGGRL